MGCCNSKKERAKVGQNAKPASGLEHPALLASKTPCEFNLNIDWFHMCSHFLLPTKYILLILLNSSVEI